MPKEHFTISSISESAFNILTRGYHSTTEDEEGGGKLRRLLRKWKRRYHAWRYPVKMSPRAAKEAAVRAVYPVFDQQFLLFALLVAEYLGRGYQIGIQRVFGSFTAYDECTLQGSVQNTADLSNGTSMLLRPHKHVAEICDIPEYARLKKIQRLTRDASISALINRITLWLHVFVVADQYMLPIVARHPKTGDVKLLVSPFFKKFVRSLPL